MSPLRLSSPFLQYLAQSAGPSLATKETANGHEVSGARLPPLSEVSRTLGMSVALLREQVEVAKALGLVEARPRLGLRRLPYSFLPAVRQSLAYALALDEAYFWAFTDLRNHIEAAYWEEATRLLTEEDRQHLRLLLQRAWDKLNGQPIQIPHEEHRQLHLTIYSRLENPFVKGLLEAYWEAYEAVGLNLYADYTYLKQVWCYHEEMVEAICTGDYVRGYQALVQHRDLLFQRPH